MQTWTMNLRKRPLKCVREWKTCLTSKGAKLAEEPTAMSTKQSEKMGKINVVEEEKVPSLIVGCLPQVRPQRLCSEAN